MGTMTTAHSATEMKAPRKLTPELVQELFSRYTNDEGELSMAHMYPYYHEDVRFQDSVQTLHGMQEFKAMGDRLLERCSQGYRMEVHSAAQNGKKIFLHWTMHMRFMGTPWAPLDGTSILTLNDEGLIVEQRDHYDLWGDTFSVIPGISKFYAWFMQKTMG